MKIVIAMDSFKGSLSSTEAAAAVREGIQASGMDAEIVIKPLADGGEGTAAAFVEGMGAEEIQLTVTGPLGKPVKSSYAVLRETNTAVIETASAVGLTYIPSELRNPLYTTSRGAGELIRDALDRGLRKFVVGIGGSGTNDGGIGMLTALGFSFLDREGRETGCFGRDVAEIDRIDSSKADPRLSECTFQIACDVNNPLCGETGASMVFGPQKGATEELAEELDRALLHFSNLVKRDLGKDTADLPGSGAAGGLGYAFRTFLNGSLEPGISIIMEAVGLEEELQNADIVITGEGRLDGQTAMGKAPVGVAKLAAEYGCQVIAFAGAVAPEARLCLEQGIDAYFPIVRGPIRREEAMEKERARRNMKETAEQVFRLISSVYKKQKND